MQGKGFSVLAQRSSVVTPRFPRLICNLVLFCAAAAIAAPAQSTFFTTLASFDGANGQFAEAPLIQGTVGNFYGTTRAGGASNHCDGGCGTVFKITPAGTLATLYSFCSQPNCTDGAGPQGLIPPVNGYFYGTTSGYTIDGYYGYGTVFKMSLSGTLTTLYSFCAQPNCADGSDPSTLVQARDGNFYGTTADGGDPTCDPSWGCGTVFRITPAGALTTLHTFEGSDGDVANSPAGASCRRKLLRNHLRWRGRGLLSWPGRLWHGIQNHPRRHPDYAL